MFNNFLPMTAFEPRRYGTGSDRSANCATTTAPIEIIVHTFKCIDVIYCLQRTTIMKESAYMKSLSRYSFGGIVPSKGSFTQ